MKKNIFVALDFSSFDKALDVANSVKNDAAGLKITNELFAICGKDGISKLANIGLEIFLDVKVHDVPNTVKNCSKYRIIKNCKIFNSSYQWWLRYA